MHAIDASVSSSDLSATSTGPKQSNRPSADLSQRKMKRKAPTSSSTASTTNEGTDANKEAKQSAPDYGSKEYWEARYRANLLVAHDTSANDNTECVDGVELPSEAQAGHAWYFSYEELRPLILRVLCNGDEEGEVDIDDFADEEWEEVDDEADQSEEDANECDDDNDEVVQSDQEETASTNDNGSDEAEIDILEAHLVQSTSQSNRPKNILEIGCGDVPLGSSLTAELNALQLSSGTNARQIVSSVECIDYSSMVIDVLNERKNQGIQQQRKHQTTDTKHQPIHPIYKTLDARHLPHPSNSISFILEKGTLDAMLSHPTLGPSNSISVIKEMARVVEVGGAILIVSHLNAREEKGMSWVNDVLLSGLREEWLERKREKRSDDDAKDEILWSIEVHGGEANESCCNVDEEQEPHFGPAVYILKKVAVSSCVFAEIMKRKGDDEVPVKMEFLTYS